MTLFQLVAVTILVLLTLSDLRTVMARSSGRWIRLIRACVWVLAASAIIHPMLPQSVATFLGIGRAADLVMYLGVLSFLWVSFFLYSCHLRVQRQVTQLTRHIAIHEATPPRG
jgi:small membrane protein